MKNILIVILIIAVVGGAMYLYLEKKSAPPENELLTGVIMQGAETGVGGDQLSVLNKLKVLVIDTSIFETKVWQSFRDSNLEIEKQPEGRSNPFAPINPNEAVFSTTTTSTSAR